jgi:hypothetical protein
LFGYLGGFADAKDIIRNLARDKNGNIVESIKVITHSMGGAYGKGYVKGLLKYIKDNNIKGVYVELIADFQPYQGGDLEAINDPHYVGPTLQFSDVSDWLAGTNKEKGVADYFLVSHLK